MTTANPERTRPRRFELPRFPGRLRPRLAQLTESFARESPPLVELGRLGPLENPVDGLARLDERARTAQRRHDAGRRFCPACELLVG